MKYDVFISYSRKDTAVAEQICAAFDSAGIIYFIDKQGIGGGFEFPVVIAEAIIECKVVLFLASRNSYDSKFTNAELTFAFNEKPKNSILPYIIDGSTMPPALRFVFSSINWRTIESHPIETTLVDDILTLIGRSRQAAPVVPTPVPAKTYKVGDYYNENGKEGVVFEVTADGLHGKIVCMTQSAEELKWASDASEQRRLIMADSQTDGAYNLAKVQAISDWQSKYPAFAWCASLGEGWYLPAIDELKALMSNVEIRDAVNSTLVAKGGTQLDSNGCYWSSMEENRKFLGVFCAWGFSLGDDTVFGGYKYYGNSVRAVATF